MGLIKSTNNTLRKLRQYNKLSLGELVFLHLLEMSLDSSKGSFLMDIYLNLPTAFWGLLGHRRDVLIIFVKP